MKKICYDVLLRKGSEFESRFFTVDDIKKVLNTSFLSYDEFTKEAYSKIKNNQERDHLINKIFSFHDSREFPYERAKVIEPVIQNDNRLLWTNLFKYKVLNFSKASGSKPMFDFYVNGESNLFINPQEENAIIVNENKHVDKGILFIRVINYGSKRGIPFPDYVDINTRINIHHGLVDSQMRSIPWFADQFVNQHELKLPKDQLYLMSPLLHHFVKVYDKILLLSKQKGSYVAPMLLKNAIDASFNDARIIAGMNEKYKLINNSFVRVVPTLKKRGQHGEYEASRFFDAVNQQNTMNAFSYSDVVNNGSGVLGSNKISIDDYEKAIFSMGMTSIPFTKEENTNNGLFAYTEPAFIDIVGQYDQYIGVSDLAVLNNHIIHVDYEKQRYVTAINGLEPLIAPNPKKKAASIKKYNQRAKHSNSRTFLYDTKDSYNQQMIVKKFDNTDYYYHRNANYMSNTKVIEETSYTRNALVAFVSSEIELPEIATLVDYSIQTLNKWFYSLRGVACEGFFTKEFLRQRMLVHRTESRKIALEDTDPAFQVMVKNPGDIINQIIPNSDKDKFIVRTFMECECTGKIIKNQCKSCNNPRPVTGELKPEYWVDFSKGFDFVKLTGVQVVDDGVNMYLEYSIPLANSRFKCEELTKSVPVETAQMDVGYLKELRLGDLTISGINVPLDGVYYGLGGFKSKTHGIPFTVLRLYNALKGEIKYSSEDCVHKTDEVNEFLSKFKKSVIRTKMYDKESGTYMMKTVEAWVGLVAISPTEVSQEFNKSRFEDERSFSKANYALNNLLGFDRLNKALSLESNLVNNKSTHVRDELFKIANIHSSVRPINPITQRAKDLAIKHDGLVQGITNLTRAYADQNPAFSVAGFDKYSLKEMVTYDEYKYILDNYPLFSNRLFQNGFVVNCSLALSKEQAAHYNTLGDVYHTIYFPNKEFLLKMFEVIGDNNVRINGLLTAYINVFETLAVSKLGNAAGSDDRSQAQLVNKNNTTIRHGFRTVNGKILSEANQLLFYKEGILNQITNIAVPRIMSKQLTDIDCPYDVAIVANNREYERVVSYILKNKYPDREQDWTTPTSNKETGESTEPGWCWLEDVYGFAVREPNLFSKQNLSAKVIWSSHRADIEYKKTLGVTFHDKHPGTKGIYLNPVFVAFNLEGDVDGDTIFLGLPYTLESQDALKEVYEEIKDMAFFDKETKNEKAKLVRDTYLVPSLQYLRDEAENLNFELDTLTIGYSYISFAESLRANFEASKNKENIGFLTVSLWYVTYFIDFYMYNYQRLVAKGYKIPELTSKDHYELLFIFQYLLAQQNGVRAMKDVGAYGKITIDALIVNKEFESDEARARGLLENLIDEYREENEKKNIEVNFNKSLTKFFSILDNLFVSYGKFKGFGYMNAPDGSIFSFRDRKWTYGEKDNSRQNSMYVDCTDRYDSYFIDFHACFLLINGRDPDVFITKFGYDKTLQSLEFRNKVHLHSPLLSFAKDVFIP